MSSEALSHDEAIEQFCGVTGATEDRAKCLLEACDWNLELAVNMHVDTDDGRSNNKPSTSSASTTISSVRSSARTIRATPSFGAGPSTSNQPEVVDINDTIMKSEADDDDDVRQIPSAYSSTLNQNALYTKSNKKTDFNSRNNDSDYVRPPIPPVRQVLIRGSDPTGSDAPQRRYNTRSGNASDVFDPFRDFQAEAQWQEMTAGGQEGESSVNEISQADLGNVKKGTLQELFRPPLELLHRGSLESARENGQQQNKWILVNVQNCREFACQTLNRDLWSNQAVKDILKEHFIFWQVYHDSYDGQRFRQFYNILTYPHVSIVDPRTGEQVKSWPNLDKIDHNTFCDSIIEFLTEQSLPDGSNDHTSMKKLRVKEEDNNVIHPTLYDQSEEAQLEAAIKASLQEQIENSNSSKAFADEDSYTDALESDNDQTITSDIQYHSNNSNSANDKFSSSSSAAASSNANTNISETFFGASNSIATSHNSNHSSDVSSNKNIRKEPQTSFDGDEDSSMRREIKREKVVDLDEYKKYLGVDKEKFSDLNIRFPDGTRNQFKFPSDSLMKALFSLLTSRGFGMDQYNYVTNFPRRLLHELPSTDTFHDAKLIRETIFVERKTTD